MPSILLTAPTVEPLSLAEAKAFLRIEHNDDDDVIGALIASARIHVEAQTRRALITQHWRLVLDAWPADGRLKVLPAPLAALDAVRVYDDNGSAGALDLQSFVVDKAGAQIVFAPSAARALDVEARERELAGKLIVAEQGRWYTALPRPLFAGAFIVYVWKVVVWDKVLGLGVTDPLKGDVADWAMIVLTAYFGGRSLEKVARILARR